MTKKLFIEGYGSIVVPSPVKASDVVETLGEDLASNLQVFWHDVLDDKQVKTILDRNVSHVFGANVHPLAIALDKDEKIRFLSPSPSYASIHSLPPLLDLEDLSVRFKLPTIEKDGFIVNVKSLTGKVHPIPATSAMSVEELKEAILDVTSTPVDQQRLIFNSDTHSGQINNDALLGDLGIEHGSVVHLVLRMRGGMLHTTSGRDGRFGVLRRGGLETVPTKVCLLTLDKRRVEFKMPFYDMDDLKATAKRFILFNRID